MNRHKCDGCKYLENKEELWCDRYKVSVDRVVNCIVEQVKKGIRGDKYGR